MWIGDVYIPETGRKRMSFPTEKEALAFEEDPYTVLNYGKSGPTVGTFFPDQTDQHYGDTKDWTNAYRISGELVRRLGADTPVRNVTTKKVEEMVSALRKEGNKASTINSKLTKLSVLLKKAKRLELIPSLPEIELLRGVGKRLRFLTPEEESRLFNGMLPQWRALSMFLLYSGCRYSEAIDLRWHDITDNKATFWETKSGKPRTVPLAFKARVALRWAKRRKLDGPFAGIAYETYRNHWKRAKKAAGLTHDPLVTPHILRHTCASRLVQRGVSITRVQKFLGHATIDMTMRYAHLAPDDLDVAADALDR